MKFFGERMFRRVCEIIPELDENGVPIEYTPQSKYRHRTEIPLHEYGSSPFCRFKISKQYDGKSGVYIIEVDGKPKYVGECEDLGKRFNMGYGNISPRNCYKGGQATNCRINNLILQKYKSESKIEVFFLETTRNRSKIEKHLIQTLKPEWNKTSGKSAIIVPYQKVNRNKSNPGKYHKLEEYFRKSKKQTEVLTYKEIEKILGFRLPESAYTYRAWWANGGHAQANSWLNAGWEVEEVKLGISITFKYMYVNHTYMYRNYTPLTIAELKVLELFVDLKRHYFAEIAKKTKLTRPRTLRALRKLAKIDILNTETEANVKYYSLNKIPAAYSLLSTVEYNKTTNFLEKNKRLKRALEMFKEKYSGYLIMLIFGSYAKGHAAKTSDIDLLLIKEGFSKNEVKKIEDLTELINGRTGLKISPYLMKIDEFKQKKDFVKEVIENHILLEGGELFFRLVLE